MWEKRQFRITMNFFLIQFQQKLIEVKKISSTDPSNWKSVYFNGWWYHRTIQWKQNFEKKMNEYNEKLLEQAKRKLWKKNTPSRKCWIS